MRKWKLSGSDPYPTDAVVKEHLPGLAASSAYLAVSGGCIFDVIGLTPPG